MFDFATGGIDAIFPDTVFNFVQVSGACSSEDSGTQLLSALLLSVDSLLGLFSASFCLNFLMFGFSLLLSFSIKLLCSRLIVINTIW